ncbi:uncharacterized protein GLRG_07362 [Colletotrichum graminicola M1.001]|uniref:Uncharacterized protein n=1 Tax=Colletotrichum graminicola (strain M1.001 / M2 / FGSC 10212) TaxID=645133 RepID=E3QMY0_COLGM|nr:uncharacterized protein GLRG_07362 [Colletotrichum graminicola M1.001]EFQ32218.1 hypothetical protein GLRG_07362 [Colletotrichum graminicola M1.001]
MALRRAQHGHMLAMFKATEDGLWTMDHGSSFPLAAAQLLASLPLSLAAIGPHPDATRVLGRESPWCLEQSRQSAAPPMRSLNSWDVLHGHHPRHGVLSQPQEEENTELAGSREQPKEKVQSGRE